MAGKWVLPEPHSCSSTLRGAQRKSNSEGRIANMFSFLWMLIVGLVVGALAKLIMPGRDPGGVLITMLLGICGAVLAGLIGRMLGVYGPGQGAGFLMSLAGSVLLLFFYRLVRGRHAV